MTNKAGKRTARRWHLLNGMVDAGWLSEMRGSDAKVWLTLYRHADLRGFVTLSEAELARQCGIDQRTARRGIARLQEAGLVTTIRQGLPATGASVRRLIL